MKEIICVENEVILNIIENELKNMDIEYLVKRVDISNLPINTYTNEYAIIFSDEKNIEIIKEIYNNIKFSQKEENKEIYYENSMLKPILKIIGVVILFSIIIIQQIFVHNYNKALTVNEESYIYKWSSDLHELNTYIAKNNYYLQKTIDSDRNGIVEIVESYYPNNIVVISEDNNQNSFYEKQTLIRNGIILMETISTDDDGICEITYYYKDGKINQTLYYDKEDNIVEMK